MATTDTDPPQAPLPPTSDKALKEQRDRNKSAYENVREGYDKNSAYDREAGNQSGPAPTGGDRDHTSGRSGSR